jgi:hypothetical protein
MLAGLADVLRRAGLTVVERPDWQLRGHGGGQCGCEGPCQSGPMFGVRSITLHHTGGPPAGEAPSLPVVEGGRPDLAGPLAHLVLGRSGTWYATAAGLCWHAGATFEPWQSNAYAIGIEAEGTGVDPWPAAQYDSYVAGARALADHYRVPYGRVLGHREVAKPHGRKVDPNFDLEAFRDALFAPREEAVPLSDADVERIARRTADLTWQRPTRNGFGEVVEAQQIVNGVELRLADMQAAVSPAFAAVDLSVLADLVVDRLAARLGGRTE